jgi:ADP-ribose pyrophosphatase
MDFKILKREPVYQGRAFNVEKVLLELPNQKQKYYDFIDHNDSVTIFPMDSEGNVYFVSQYRLGAQTHLIELPAGVMEPGEKPEECAKREVQEEIGFAAGNLRPLGDFYLVPGYCNEHMYSFLATEIYPSNLDPDEDEFLNVIKVPYREVIKKMQAGEIQDVKTLAVIAQVISIFGI